MDKPSDEKKKYKTWSKSVTMDDMTKTIEVREVENGFIIKKCMYGHMEGSDEYIDEKKEYISTTNPMEEKEEKEEKEGKGMELINSIKSMFGGEKEIY